MTAFLASFVADLLAVLLQKLGGDISSYIEQVKKINQDRADRLIAAQASVKPLKEANPNDGKAIDDAGDDALNGV